MSGLPSDTVVQDVSQDQALPAPHDKRPESHVQRGLRRHLPWLVGTVLITFLSALYVADLVSERGRVPRNLVVLGVQLGGLAPAEAERALRIALEPRAAAPVAVLAGELREELPPRAAGLDVDWTATIEVAMVQPVTPWARLRSLVADRDAEVVSAIDRGRLTAALEQLDKRVTRAPVEGAVTFSGTRPVAVEPVAGQRLDPAAAAQALEVDWLTGRPVALPLVEIPTVATSADVRQVIDTVARPAVSAPVVVEGEGVRAVVQPEVIASAVSFTLASSATDRFAPQIDQGRLVAAVTPQLAPSETPARKPTVSFAAGVPTVTPAQDGRSIDYAATFSQISAAFARTGEDRRVSAVYVAQPAKISDEQVRRALAAGEMGGFSTGGFAPDSGQNIRRAAELINGAVIGPGETFSLNAATNPRDASRGFVEAGIIEEGRPGRGVGGGVSQVATTLYNAAYFAGMTDVEHREHSYYISRYPPAREATVFGDVIDVKFRNDSPGVVVIQTGWTRSAVTIKLLGEKAYEVTSRTGPRTNPKPPEQQTISDPKCKPSSGSSGFTTSDTRIVRDLRTGQTRSSTRTVVYKPAPRIVCD